MRLAHEVAIITGAARGIGKAIALALIRKAPYWFFQMSARKSIRPPRRLGSRWAEPVLVGNVTKMADCEAMVAEAIKSLVNLIFWLITPGLRKITFY